MAKFQTKAFLGQRPIVLPDDASAEWTTVDIEFPTTAPVASDLIELCELPIGIKCLDWFLTFPDIDTGAAALAFSLGTENAGSTDLSAEVWGAALTAGQSTSIVRNALSICSQGDITANRKIALKVTTAAATYAGAGKTGQLVMLLQA
jgi:hypothetical protein